MEIEGHHCCYSKHACVRLELTDAVAE